MSQLNKFDVDAALDCVDLRFSNYTPSLKALEFFNYIRVFIGEDFEIDSPMWHYFLVDLLLGQVDKNQFPYTDEVIKSITLDPTSIAVLAARGSGKSSVTTLFYPIYASILGTTPVTGPLSHILILSDSQQGGSTSQARIMASTFEKSAFAKEWFEHMRFTDTEIELVRRNRPGQNLNIEKRHMLIKFRGIQSGGIRSGSRNPVTGDRYALLCHKKGTIVTTDMGTHRVENYYNVLGERKEYGLEVRVKGLPFPEVVTNEHRYWTKLVVTKRLFTLPDIIGWTEDVDLRPIASNEHNYWTRVGRTGDQTTSLDVDTVIGWTEAKDLTPNHMIGTVVKPNSTFAWRQVESITPTSKEEIFVPITTPTRTYTTAFGLSHNCADDVIKNEDEAYSETIMEKVKTALESDAENAMRSRNTQMIIINTPFHKNDPVYKIVEGGAYTPLVVPLCKVVNLDLPKTDFVGLWEESHSYESVMKRWRKAVANGGTRAFNQELMLRVSNEEDRMISDDLIQWYDRSLLMKLIDGYNIYITTDFTTTSAANSDFSGIAVWAINSNEDWFLLDLNLKRLELLEQYEALFRMVQTYSRGGKHIEVGVEIDGQQKAHIFSLKEMMQKRNVYFSFARQRGAPIGREGILSKAGGSSKIERFRYVLPLFQNHKFYFPTQLKDTPDLKEGLKQIKGATHVGFTYKDDMCDLCSQIAMLDYSRPMFSESIDKKDNAFIGSEGDLTWMPTKDSDNYAGSTVF